MSYCYNLLSKSFKKNDFFLNFFKIMFLSLCGKILQDRDLYKDCESGTEGNS